MPFELFRRELDSFRCVFCDLKDLGRLADRIGTSLTSALKYVSEQEVELAMLELWEKIRPKNNYHWG